MSRRHREWGKRRRLELVAALGGKCAVAGCTRTNLEIDHVDGRDYEARKLDPSLRATRYWREFLSGVRLQVLCKYHNGQRGRPQANRGDEPF